MIKRNPLSLAISCALVSGAIAVSLLPQSVEAEGVETADREETAAYSLKIITRGEGAPVSANDTPDALQQNRRVDVSIKAEVPVKEVPASVATAPVPVKEIAKDLEESTVGNYWISQDPALLKPSLGLKVSETVNVENGKLESPLKISIASNYGKFIDRWQLRFYAPGSTLDSEPVYILQGKLDGALTDTEWNGEITAGDYYRGGFLPDQKLEVAVRVYDKNGAFDQTAATEIMFVAADITDKKEFNLATEEELSVKALSARLEAFQQDFLKQSIPVTGSTVTVRGQDLGDIKSLQLNGEKVTLDDANRFALQYILPPGDHQFDIEEQRTAGEKVARKLDVTVKPGYFFVVGIADLTVGDNNISGNIETLAADDQHFGGDLFVDGRLAFYLKGKVKGKYLLTAQLDSGTEDVTELFDNFNRQDTDDVFRRIDPDQFYLVYGDDSSIVDDTDSKGKLYLRVDWDKSHALWGNFNTALSGTEFAPFNRSLYGAQYRHLSLDATNLGDNKTEIAAFASEAQTLFRHNEFAGTGGSLYYLRDQDIVLGSEKVWVEVRRNNSEQVLERIPLERYRDYEIDEFQGRIILTRPLLSISAETGPSIIRDEPLAGDNTFLNVDYEYVPLEFTGEDATTLGARGKRWINNHVAIGGTWARENREADDYSVKGVDVTLKKSDDTYVRLEAARSESGQTSGSFLSSDGGLTFSEFNVNDGVEAGNAFGIEARVSASDIVSINAPVTVAGWAKSREAGYSTANLDSGVDVLDVGVEITADVHESLSLSGRATSFELDSESRESMIAVQADYYYSDNVVISSELRRVNNEALATGDSEAATLAAGKVDVRLNDVVSVYGAAQGVLDRSGNYDDNTLLSVGGTARVTDNLNVKGEISAGDRGTNVTVGAEQRVSDTYSVYGNLSFFNDRVDVVEQVVTVGQRKDINKKLNVYTEHQFSTEVEKTGLANTIGLTNTFNRYTTGTISFQSSRLEDESQAITERDTLSAGLRFKRRKSSLTTKLEYRQDESDTIDTDQWVVANNLEYRQSASMRWQGRLNHSETEDNINGDNARFTEAGIGFAYRPVFHDRLNVLGRYTFLYDLPPEAQSTNTDRRSSIYSFESIYDIGRRWSVGGKLAHRDEEIRTERGGGIWVGNDATVVATRLRYKVWFGVDVMGSYQWLNSDASDNTRHGALFSVGHNIGDNLQFSVGYNFTSFDGNLGNDDFDVRGWFLNLVGKY